jgi:hypothetical protein
MRSESVLMLIAGRYAVGGSPFLEGWKQEYMKAQGSMPPPEKVMDFLVSVIRNESIPMQNKQAEIRMLDQMQRFSPEVKNVTG